MATPDDESRTLKAYFSRFKAILEDIDIDQIARIAQELKEAKVRGGKIFVCGNGGSAALASHFVTDLGSGSVSRGEHFPLISLVDCSPAITAAGNDFGYESIFARQLTSMATRADLLFAISSSGNSQNLINGVTTAKTIGMRSCGLLGFDGGKLASELDVALIVRSKIGEYGPVEDAHSSILHAVTELLRNGKRLDP